MRSLSQGRNNSVQPGIPKIHCQETILSYAPLFPHFVPSIILVCSVGERLNFKFGVNNGKELEAFCEGWTLIRETNFFEAMKRYSWIACIADLLFRKMMNRLAVYEFKL